MELETTDENADVPIIQLPNVIWQLILNLVPQKNLVEHRLVCKRWRANIDRFAGFQIDFFEQVKPPILDRIFDLRIRSCSFHCLKEPFQPRFKFPLLIKDVTVSNVSSENLINILSTCTHVEKLRFFSTLTLDKQFEADKDYSKVLQLRNLQTLDIGIYTIGTRGLTSRSSTFDTLFVRNVEVLHFDVLTNLNICFSMMPGEWVQLFDFISRHSRTLSSVELRCMCTENLCNVFDFSEVNLTHLRKYLNLRSLILRCDSPCRVSTLHSIFDSIVGSQKSLEIVNLRYGGLKSTLLVDVITNCKETLRSAKFSRVDLGFAEDSCELVLDHCPYLKDLVLDFVEKTYIVVPVEFSDEHIIPCKVACTSVSELSLPKGLSFLKWIGLWIRTSEIVRLCESDERPRELRTLEVLDIGTKEDFGVTVEVFSLLCQRFPKLERIAIGQVNRSTEAEVQTWRRIVELAKDIGIYGDVLENDTEFPNTFYFVDPEKKEEFLQGVDLLLA